MLGFALVAALAAAVSTAALAGAAETGKPSTLPPNLEFTAEGGFAPRALAKTTPTPVELAIAGKVGTRDGTHPPALRDLAIKLDKEISVNLSGYPVCRSSKAEACRSSIVGNGTIVIEIELAEVPITVRSRVQIFNGASTNGIRTLYLAADITVPVPASIVATAQIKRIHDGLYGTEAFIAFPKIAGGSGSITSFNLRIKKRLPLEGKQFSPVTAKCPSGKLQFRDTATFFNFQTSETSRAPREVLRTCTGK